MKFDEILAFLNGRVFEVYEVSRQQPRFQTALTLLQEEAAEGVKESPEAKMYKVDEFVSDAVGLRITPFMLDSYAREYNDMVRVRDAHAVEMDLLRNSNRNLAAQV